MDFCENAEESIFGGYLGFSPFTMCGAPSCRTKRGFMGRLCPASSPGVFTGSHHLCGVVRTPRGAMKPPPSPALHRSREAGSPWQPDRRTCTPWSSPASAHRPAPQSDSHCNIKTSCSSQGRRKTPVGNALPQVSEPLEMWLRWP